MVPQSVSAGQAVRLQWRRLSNLELPAVPRDDDFRPACGRVAPRRTDAGQEILDLDRRRDRRIDRRLRSRRLGDLPLRQTHLDSAWAIFSGGWTCLLLAAFYGAIDLRRHRSWAFPLAVVGMNSIAMYCMAHLIYGFIKESFKVHLGRHVFETLGTAYTSIVEHATILLVLWLICLWLYRRKIFLRI